jgi:hypothetical protein
VRGGGVGVDDRDGDKLALVSHRLFSVATAALLMGAVFERFSRASDEGVPGQHAPGREIARRRRAAIGLRRRLAGVYERNA